MITSPRKIEIAAVVLLLSWGNAAASADATGWAPRVGALTCEQETEIELVSQSLALTEYRTISTARGSVPVFDAEAEFRLKNSSLAKKKPTMLLSLCRLTDGSTDVSVCDLDLLALRIAVDKRPVNDFRVVRVGSTVYARFSVKFNVKMRKEVTATFRLPERFAAVGARSVKRPFTTFDYHLEDSVKWKGKVGYSHVSVKMPYKATMFNTHLFGDEKPFRYKNRIAYLEKRRLTEENAESITFFATTPAFQEKVKAAHRKVKALPQMIKRRLRLIRLLEQYPGAYKDLEEHADIVLRAIEKEWDMSKRKHAVELYTRFLEEAIRFEDESVRCEETLCVEKDALSRMISVLCADESSCVETLTGRFNACCDEGSQAAAVAVPSPVDTDTAAEQKAASDVPAVQPEAKESLSAKYFEYFVAHWPIFLAIFIVMGWLGIASRNRNKPKMKELE